MQVIKTREWKVNCHKDRTKLAHRVQRIVKQTQIKSPHRVPRLMQVINTREWKLMLGACVARLAF